MSDAPFEARFLRTIGMVMTYKCQIACPHCVISAGPNRREEVALDDAINWIEQISEYRNGFVNSLALTGGEPFYDLDKLKKISSFADNKGLFVTAVTNAFWAATYKDSLETLAEVPYIKALAVSTDVYHLESIPFERVKNAISACEAYGIPYCVNVCTNSSEDEGYNRILDELRRLVDERSIFTVITIPAGRASTLGEKSKFAASSKPPISACSASSAPVIFPDGRMLGCIGPVIDLDYAHPLFLGNLKKNSLQEILDRAELNAILHALRAWGPAELIDIIKRTALSSSLPNSYIEKSICSACYNILSEPDIVDFLFKLAQDREFISKVAYARSYYLKENEMINLLLEGR